MWYDNIDVGNILLQIKIKWAVDKIVKSERAERIIMMKEYTKRNYTMKAEKVAAGTKLYNFLEDCHYTTNDVKCIKLIGTVGEVWPVTIEKLAKTYTLIDGTPITEENIPEGEFEIATIVDENAETIFAEQVTDQVKVATSWGELLTANRDGIPHGEGDFIVSANKEGQPNPDDRWVVNGMVFINTYKEV